MTPGQSRRPLDPLIPWVVFLTATGTLYAVLAIFGEAHHWRPEYGNYLNIIFAGSILGIAARTVIGWRFGRNRDLRRALVALLAERRGGAWLNRDEHLVFGASRQGWFPARALSVIRLDEDVQQELDSDEAVRTAVAFEQFVVFPFTRGVVRSDEALLITRDEAGDLTGGKLPGTPGTIRSLWRTLRMPRGMGTTWAQPDEVRELLSQFGTAERVGDFERG